MIRLYVISIFYLLFFPLLVFSETLTLDQCLGKAFEANPDLKKAELSYEAAKARVYQSITSFLPSLSAGGNYTHLSENPPTIDFPALLKPGATFPQITGNPLLQYEFMDNYSAFLQVNQPLFAGGRIYYQYKSSYSDYKIQDQQLKLMRANLEIEIIKAFYNVILAKEMKTLAITATNSLGKDLNRITELVENGAATDYDRLKAESLLLTWLVTYTKSERDLKNSIRDLKLLMHDETTKELDIKGELDYSEEENELLTIESAKSNALKKRPEIIIADESSKIGTYTEEIKRSSLLPQINLQYNYYFLDKDKSLSLDSSKWNNYWDARLLFSWEIFSWGKSIAAVKESKLNLEQSEVEENNLQDKIKNEVEDAFDLQVQTKKAVQAYKMNLDVKQDSYKIVNDNYKNGTMVNTDVLDAEISLLDAKNQYLKALYDYKVASSNFKKITGSMYEK